MSKIGQVDPKMLYGRFYIFANLFSLNICVINFFLGFFIKKNYGINMRNFVQV